MGKSKQPSPPDPNVIAGTQGQLNRQNIADIAAANRPQQFTPFGSNTWSQDPSGLYWTNYQNIDPRIVNNYYKQIGLEDQGMDLGSFMMNNVYSTIRSPDGTYRAFDPTTIPGMQTTIDPSMTIGQVDLQGLQEIPGENDFGGERQRVEDATYGRQTARLDPQFNQRQKSLEDDLMNQGFARGSEGWNQAMDSLNREREAAYSGARNDAIAMAGGEQSRLFNDALAARGQGVGERFQSAGFFNNAGQQDFSQRFQAGQFQNANRSQRFGEELAKRNQVIDEFTRMLGLSSGGTQLPQFQGAAQINGPSAPDFTSAAMGAYNGQVAGANARQGNKNSNTGAVASIGAAALAAF